ncbi:MAG: hypothetical protein IT372_18600 [Polyangiaceae bacterium]|nr:hypothetical protein [Polyangiaceae bacterium]
MRAHFLLLLKEHLAFLLGYVRHLGFQRPDVEDIVQETLAGAYQNLDRFDPSRGDVREWLAGIAENQAKSFRARAYHRHEVSEAPPRTDKVNRP